MKTNFIPFGAFMQNDFTSSFLSSELPDEAILLGFASSSLTDYISDDDFSDPLGDYFNGRPLNASRNFETALRGFSTAEGRRNGGDIMQKIALGYLFRCMSRQGVTFPRLLARGVDPELVEALYTAYCETREN
jgi:hypothetical protein